MLLSGFLLPSILLLLLFEHGDAASIRNTFDAGTIGCQSCPATDPKKLNIHLVAHTHDDVGWLKTVDQYYFGSRPTIQKAGVQYILDSVIQALLANPERKFIYVETAFLWKWWLRQNDKVKEDVRNLINQGRLEIISGGWSMNDEAVTHYHSIVDQFTWGFRRLNDTFGSCARPRIGWQIDPFGHSREQASLFAQFGFDGMFFGRLDYQDKSKRLQDQNMEFIWKGSPNLGSRANLFTVALYNTYSPPPGFCFDVLCNDDPINDDPDSPDYNVKEKVEKLLSYAHHQAESYKTNNIIFTMGEDFNYQHAEMWFTNLDRLIRYVREEQGTEVNIFYSTPSCYMKALNDANLQWPTKDDDFFPYASDPHSYWTGYFSSRPTIKFFERMGNNLLQISKQLAALVNLNGYDKQLEHFREAMGVMQHHDAVTGTEKQLVADDYARILYSGMEQGTNISVNAIRKWGGGSQNDLFSCMQLNISVCEHTEEDSFILTIYNPFSRVISSPIRVPVQSGEYKVRGLGDNYETLSQVVPIAESVIKIPGRVGKATHELVFMAILPALGYTSYNITKYNKHTDVPSNTSFIGNQYFNVSVNEGGEILVEWTRENNMSLTQSFHYYEGMEGNNKVFQNRSSGAYIFRPRDISTKNFAKRPTYQIYKGPIVDEIHYVLDDWVSQVIRIYKVASFVEFDWLVGPIPVKDNIGKEIVTKYSSNLNSAGEFYTDLNGREMLKRKRNFRPTWDLKLEEQVAGNYYPITSKISLTDISKSQKFSVLVDRAEGGTSMKDGEIEMMVHRRLLKDDAFGVGEALNETAFGEGLVARGTHYILGGNTEDVTKRAMDEKYLALQLQLRPWFFITPLPTNSLTPEDSESIRKSMASVSGITKSLPRNVQILTLEPWKENSILLRLEHIFEIGESGLLSNPVEVNIQDLFSTFTILSVKETTLGANQLINEMDRLDWKPETESILEKKIVTRSVELIDGVINILLHPMEIRTFILQVVWNNS